MGARPTSSLSCDLLEHELASIVTLSIIVCMARNGVIGRSGGMPWRMPSDLAHFKAVTMGKPCIMGRKTFFSLGKPLSGRPHIVITRDSDQAARITAAFKEGAPPCHIVGTLAAAIDVSKTYGGPEVMILGGGEIFAQALPLAQRVYQTVLAADIEGDARFPALSAADWREVSRAPLATGLKDDYAAGITVYERR
jgi:dihydrofolate reductase